MTVATATLAFDKQSARSFDADGRMRVRDCVISVAEVNPYYGREIPGWQSLGLDPNRVYDMYRDPLELERGADSFNGQTLMVRHVAQTADEPQKESACGSVHGTNFNRATGQLRSDLFVYDAQAIELIDSRELADLSSSYRYTPDMTHGVVNGRKYDGVMRNIAANHVALVKNGRATGAHVADSALIPQTGASTMDFDKKDDTPGETVTEPNAGVPAAPAAATGGVAELAAAVVLLTKELGDLKARVDAGGTAVTGPVAGEAEALAVDPPAVISDDADEVDASGDTPAEREKEDDDTPAMDAKAVKALVTAAVTAERVRAEGVEAAKRATRHVLGDMIAMDSAGDIYREALKAKGVDVAQIAKGHEQTAWVAFSAASGGRGAAPLANDSRTTREPGPFDKHLGLIRNAGR